MRSLLKKYLMAGLTVVCLPTFLACASHRPAESADEPLSAHQSCLLSEQNKKKAVYEALPALLKQVSGDSQIVAEHGGFAGALPLNPSSKDLQRAIATVPVNDAGMWGTEKEGHAFTASGFVVRDSEFSLPKTGENISLFRFSVGQPGRSYSAPLGAFRAEGKDLVANLNETYRVSPTSGLERKPYLVTVRAKLRLNPIDNQHVLVLVDDRSPRSPILNMERRHALLIRTYGHRDFDTKDLWQDWPVFDEGSSMSSCDSVK